MRRAFSRPFRQGAGQVPPLLRRANQLMAAGDFAGAADAYEQFARNAEARRGPRAPMIYLQAGRASVLANQAPRGMTDLKHGLHLFSQRGQFGKVFNAGNRIVGELKERGLNKEADELGALVQQLLAGKTNFSQSVVPGQRPSLPTHCPSCGAVVRTDEIEWLDDATAECAYCGSPVRGE